MPNNNAKSSAPFAVLGPSAFFPDPKRSDTMKTLMLTDDVDGLGIVGDIVDVANGYARNFLIPKGLGAPATEALKKRLAQKRAAREAELSEQFEHATTLAGRLVDTTLTIKVKVSPEGKLYGSVTEADVEKAAKEQNVGIKKEQVALGKPIRTVGTFKVPLVLHRDVNSSIKVIVEGE